MSTSDAGLRVQAKARTFRLALAAKGNLGWPADLDAVENVVDGEFVEITPNAIRIGKEKQGKKHAGLG